MSLFEPLIRIGGTAFPYWVMVVVLLSLLSGFIAKKTKQASFWFSVLGNAGALCGLLFIAFGIYVQLAGNAMAFAELLPSSFLVAMVICVPLSILAWWQSDKSGIGMLILGMVLFSVLPGVFMAFLISFAPKIIVVQWHLLKLL